MEQPDSALRITKIETTPSKMDGEGATRLPQGLATHAQFFSFSPGDQRCAPRISPNTFSLVSRSELSRQIDDAIYCRDHVIWRRSDAIELIRLHTTATRSPNFNPETPLI